MIDHDKQQMAATKTTNELPFSFDRYPYIRACDSYLHFLKPFFFSLKKLSFRLCAKFIFDAMQKKSMKRVRKKEINALVYHEKPGYHFFFCF